MRLLDKEEIIDALRLNPCKERWSEDDWNNQITREIKLVSKAQDKKTHKVDLKEFIELIDTLEAPIIKAKDRVAFYAGFLRFRYDIREALKQSVEVK